MTIQINCGGIPIGGDAPIPIQSMTNTYTEDVKATVTQINELAEAGCDIVRCAVPTIEAAHALKEICIASPIPVVADIHFDYKLAILAIEAGVDKIRINPGNIGSIDRIKSVVDVAKDKGIPIRIGVNSGSLEKDLLEKYGGATPEALAESAIRNIELFDSLDFSDIVVSIKSSDVLVNTKAHMILSEKIDKPLHIGITEAGIGERAIVKSAVGLGALLAHGIGDTLRVSLTGNPIQEIAAAKDILRSVNRLDGAINLISCPTCGRCKTDLAKIAGEVSTAIIPIEQHRINESKNTGDKIKSITVAVMGCAVNGPGEASHADLGVACGESNAIYFESGKKIDSISTGEIVDRIISGIKKLI